jgi:hypothetical protein
MKIGDIEKSLITRDISRIPRLVLNIIKQDQTYRNRIQYRNELLKWSDDSVGYFSGFQHELNGYGQIPSLSTGSFFSTVTNQLLAKSIVQDIRLCARIFLPMKGNRSCFDKCD